MRSQYFKEPTQATIPALTARRDSYGNRIRFEGVAPYWSEPKMQRYISRCGNPSIIPLAIMKPGKTPDSITGIRVPYISNERGIRRAHIIAGLEGHTRKERVKALRDAKLLN